MQRPWSKETEEAISLGGPWGELPWHPDNHNLPPRLYEITSESASANNDIKWHKPLEPFSSAVGLKKLLSMSPRVLGYEKGKGCLPNPQFSLLQKLPELHWCGDKLKLFVEMEFLDCLQASFMQAPSGLCRTDTGKWFTVCFPRDRLPEMMLASIFIHSSIYLSDTW